VRNGTTGTDEHHNARIQGYLPTRTDFQTITGKELREIITEINNQPRKHLNQETPAETYQHPTQPHNHTTTQPQCCTSNLNTGFTPVWFLRLTSQGVPCGHPDSTPDWRTADLDQRSSLELHRITISLRNETDTKLVRTLINVERLFPSSCARWSSDLDETAKFFQRDWFRQKEPI